MAEEKQNTTVRLAQEDYEWFWAERKPGESFKKAFARLRLELIELRAKGGRGG